MLSATLVCLSQLKDDNWDGVFVDVIDREVEHRSHIRVVLQRAPVRATSTTPPKCRKSSQEIWDKRMKEIEEDCQDLSDRISFKKKRIVACENMRDYKKCDELKEEVTALKKQHRQLESELKGINCQSQWYRKRK